MKEQWKTVKDYEDYEVSNLGRVKSLGNNKNRKEKLLKPKKNKWGYLLVTLCKNGIKKYFLVHRLVYSTFVKEIPEGLQVNHIDEDKENNRVENLNLMTSKENNNWGTRNRRAAVKIAATLTNHPQKSKAVEAIDKITGRVVYTFPSTMEAQRQGFHSGNVSECCNGKQKSHKGFIWRYIECHQERDK